MPKSRTEAFSDGVFAIAITLLIIEVRVPDSQSGELGRDLANQWPSYAAYLVSFVIIGIIWVNHHDIFERITTVDRPLLFLNLLLLLTVAFLPFPTARLGQYIRQGEQLANEINMYADMVKNSRTLSAHNFGAIMNDINALANIVQGGRALAYSLGNLDQQFRQTYPGYGYNAGAYYGRVQSGHGHLL